MSRALVWSAATITGLALFASPEARADFYLHSWNDHHESGRWLNLGAEIDIFSSSENFDASGSRTIPIGFQSYNRMGLDLNASFGLTDRLSAFGTLSWARVAVESTSLTASAYGLGDQSAGLNLRVFGSLNEQERPRTALDFQLQADFAGYSNSNARADGLPFLGDGSTDVTVGSFLMIPLLGVEGGHLIAATLGMGYTFRSAGFSTALPYSALLQLTPRKDGLIVGGGLSGTISMETDSQAAGTAALSSGAGGSFMTNAVNPSLLRAQGKLGWKLDSKSDLRIAARVEGALRGKGAPAGTLVALLFEWRLPGSGASGGSSERADAESLSRLDLDEASKRTGSAAFVTYSLEARVTSVNDRLSLARIDKGSAENVESGQLWDLFTAKADGSVLTLVARAKVLGVKEDEAALEIVEYYKDVWIEKGFVAKRVVAQ